MWEILTECEQLPFSKFSNAQILENVQNILKQSSNAVCILQLNFLD